MIHITNLCRFLYKRQVPLQEFYFLQPCKIHILLHYGDEEGGMKTQEDYFSTEDRGKERLDYYSTSVA